MKTKIFYLLFIVVCSISCGKKDVLPKEIDPADASTLSKVIIIPEGNRQNGDAPTSTNDSKTPSVISNVSSVISSNGGTVPLSFSYNNVNGNLAGCYVQIEGADTFYNVPYNSTSGISGRLSLPITLPTNVIAGNFNVLFAVYDQNGRISSYQKVRVQVLQLGTGALQISLSWDSGTDQDLHVTDPSGYNIYYSDPRSSTGGELDRDDIDGYGPENIFWADAPDGKYRVRVDDYEYSSSANTCYVTINAPNKNKTYTIKTQYGSTVDVITFTKNGSNYDF